MAHVATRSLVTSASRDQRKTRLGRRRERRIRSLPGLHPAADSKSESVIQCRRSLVPGLSRLWSCDGRFRLLETAMARRPNPLCPLREGSSGSESGLRTEPIPFRSDALSRRCNTSLRPWCRSTLPFPRTCLIGINGLFGYTGNELGGGTRPPAGCCPPERTESLLNSRSLPSTKRAFTGSVKVHRACQSSAVC
jgi:hypothetical protein